MNSQAALFQILYQNDTLYQLNEKVYEYKPAPVQREFEEEKASEKASVPTITVTEKPVPEIPAPLAAEPEPAAPVQAGFPELKHKVLILIDEPKQKELLTSESLFLDNILKAVKYSVSNADIVNVNFIPRSDARSILAEKKTNYFITFGVPLIRLQLDLLLIPYIPKQVEGIWFLLTDPLVVIEADRDLKRKLWQALQKMFENA